MSLATNPAASPFGSRRTRRTVAIAAIAVVVVGAIALDTKVVRIGSAEDERQAGFSPEAYGATAFPKIQAAVEAKAVDAATLATALAADSAAATAKYGVASGTGPLFSVRFTGTVGTGKSGIYTVSVEGMPAGDGIRVQTGPAINGTELRDATGEIQFGQFKNQIEFQNAGSAINKEMKKQVLASVDTANLSGKTIKVVGVFRLLNPKNWLVTPVKLDVQ
ncbi:DUF2291 family protein [Segnochrobactrum spirostomi]|uniref:DUF2291 domain-containing protein n=1 Tax=Segnochrobactrum spirostomi TaxID=2608987 RepID=A0A6A7Y9R1_9HYPH|nr:DUF2291 domain-containing protein [Segnochrobactrum spirostomi]MQT14738.1 DUF2291 domain-containing protein [Segnochrobactrum spirostomi]